jgi:predicted acylesterase/phospholipase RssA
LIYLDAKYAGHTLGGMTDGVVTEPTPTGETQSQDGQTFGEPSAAGIVAAESYAAPPRQCDVVMSGGVTSGVVYPPVIAGLAQEYQFRSVGGTSAGAIAAAATAAAEYRRQQGIAYGRTKVEIGDGFAKLADLPKVLSTNGKLFSLFQPTPATAPVFSLGVACLGNPKGRGKRVVAAALAAFPFEIGLGAISGLVVGTLPAWLGAVHFSWHIVYTVVWSVALAAVGAAIGIGGSIAIRALGPLVQNGFGFCSGMRGADVRRSRRGARQSTNQAISEWLSDYLNNVAGKPIANGPLTFGDLWYADRKDPPPRAAAGALTTPGDRAPMEPVIKLAMMTSCLTLGRPFQLPHLDRTLFYRQADMAMLFPAFVVSWMVAHAGHAKSAAEKETWPSESAIIALPEAADLPVVVGVRLSLSFPVLFTAVKLLAVDASRAKSADRVPEPCWFSDGGLTSNFPVNFFDAALPRRPTFAINLSPAPDDAPDAIVAMPAMMAEEVPEQWTRFDHVARGVQRKAPSAAGMASGFLGAILDTAKNWHDALQIRVPGYRERVATVYLQEGEGGLTVNMPDTVVAQIAERGAKAAAAILQRYAVPANTVATGLAASRDVPVSWSAHRWGRYRSTMNVIQDALRQFSAAVAATPLAGDPSLADLVIEGSSDRAPFGYPFRSHTMIKGAPHATAELAGLLGQWEQRDLDFGSASYPPVPTPELRIVPQA